MAYEDQEKRLLQLLGAQIQRLRKERTGLSQEKFALRSGVNRAYLASVERGTINVSTINLCRMAEALGTTPAELFAFAVPPLLENTMNDLVIELTGKVGTKRRKQARRK